MAADVLCVVDLFSLLCRSSLNLLLSSERGQLLITCNWLLGQLRTSRGINILLDKSKYMYPVKTQITGVNQKVLPVLSTETLLHIWLSTEYYALVICNHGPPTPGNSGDFDFCPADPC